MEGPSLFLAAEQLKPFEKKKILRVGGNTKIGKERLFECEILEVFSFGKQLFLQFQEFALRTHFLLFGSFEATIDEKKVTGDYERKVRTPRLALEFENGHLEFYSCSVKYVESENVKNTLDFSIDTMSDQWDGRLAFKKILLLHEHEIGDVLLDQNIFAGVGNIIKNEVLHRRGIDPRTKIALLTHSQIKGVISEIRKYVFEFYEWRKQFELKKHYQAYRQKTCKRCGNHVMKIKTGERRRWSFICPHCQKLPSSIAYY